MTATVELVELANQLATTTGTEFSVAVMRVVYLDEYEKEVLILLLAGIARANEHKY
ncbi:MAG: hypothetical protein H3C68_01435 [Deltaproteobacteria bacterium]|nr:hypothetical protein [Deltaproteobacteria bacterium]MBZ0219084.1 hypothetical protein [Deltaproteobacteria bacterium]